MVKGSLLVLVGFALGIAAAAFFSSPADPADVPEATQTVGDLPEPYYTVLWENDVVRVVEHVLEAGDHEPMHFHSIRT